MVKKITVKCNKMMLTFFSTDRDADETLTWEEYSSIPINSILVKYTEDKREEEFYNFIDRNRDGKLDKKEILVILKSHNSYDYND